MSETLALLNPATEELIVDQPLATAHDADAAIELAAAALDQWRSVAPIDRAKVLRRFADTIADHAEELAQLETANMGMPIANSRWCADTAADVIHYYAGCVDKHTGSTVPVAGGVTMTFHEPLGVVGVITPWNFPMLIATWKIGPALACGNTVVIKPSELTPLATLRMVDRALAHLPHGVVNVVTGGPDVGAALVDDPRVACIAFTGSTAVGTSIAVRAAARLARVNLELGGIDPLIVFEDADLDVAVPGAAWARFLNNGQVCTSAKRIFVVEPIARSFVDRFVAHTATLRLGDGLDPDTDLGPLISEKARARVEDQVRRGIAAGARVLAGGQRAPEAGRGWFYRPTILVDVTPTQPVVCEEVFGPIASIQVVKTAGDAIAAAAQSEFGLGANIYTQNLTWALTAMQEIKAGTFWINDPLTDNDAAPFGGMRKSGMGRELGEEGLDAFRETKHVHLDFVPEKKSFWFPNRQRRAEIPE